MRALLSSPNDNNLIAHAIAANGAPSAYDYDLALSDFRRHQAADSAVAFPDIVGLYLDTEERPLDGVAQEANIMT